MYKKLFILSVNLLMTITFVNLANAALIDYNRRTKRGGSAAPSGRGPAAPAQPAQPPAPAWARQSPRVETAEERRYDINRDGILQTAEVKIFLRDIIDVIVQKGGFTVNSNILRPYDKNRDGIVSSTELPELRSDVSR